VEAFTVSAVGAEKKDLQRTSAWLTIIVGLDNVVYTLAESWDQVWAMRGVNDRNFMNAWQILYRASCPSPTQALWRVEDVLWRKERHSFFASSYSVSIDVHLLRREPKRGAGWQLMVVVENWWSGGNEIVKTSNWARTVEGNARDVVAWVASRQRPASSAAD
jgi:hypothetical protein